MSVVSAPIWVRPLYWKKKQTNKTNKKNKQQTSFLHFLAWLEPKHCAICVVVLIYSSSSSHASYIEPEALIYGLVTWDINITSERHLSQVLIA